MLPKQARKNCQCDLSVLQQPRHLHGLQTRRLPSNADLIFNYSIGLHCLQTRCSLSIFFFHKVQLLLMALDWIRLIGCVACSRVQASSYQVWVPHGVAYRLFGSQFNAPPFTAPPFISSSQSPDWCCLSVPARFWHFYWVRRVALHKHFLHPAIFCFQTVHALHIATDCYLLDQTSHIWESQLTPGTLDLCLHGTILFSLTLSQHPALSTVIIPFKMYLMDPPLVQTFLSSTLLFWSTEIPV